MSRIVNCKHHPFDSRVIHGTVISFLSMSYKGCAWWIHLKRANILVIEELQKEVDCIFVHINHCIKDIISANPKIPKKRLTENSRDWIWTEKLAKIDVFVSMAQHCTTCIMSETVEIMSGRALRASLPPLVTVWTNSLFPTVSLISPTVSTTGSTFSFVFITRSPVDWEATPNKLTGNERRCFIDFLSSIIWA